METFWGKLEYMFSIIFVCLWIAPNRNRFTLPEKTYLDMHDTHRVHEKIYVDQASSADCKDSTRPYINLNNNNHQTFL